MPTRQVRISEHNYLRLAQVAGEENRTIRQQLDVILNSALAERRAEDWQVGGRVIPDMMEDDHFHPDPKKGKGK